VKQTKAKRFVHILTWVFAVFWILFAGTSMVYVIAAGRSPNGPELFGYKFMMVLSDSMIPTIHSGDLVVGQPPKLGEIGPGQVITYRNHRAQRLITHRVVQVTKAGDELAFITQGDGNNQPDEIPVPARDVVATFTARVPYAGYLFSFTKTWYGFVVMVIVPSLILMGTEILRLTRLLKDENHRAQPD